MSLEKLAEITETSPEAKKKAKQKQDEDYYS